MAQDLLTLADIITINTAGAKDIDVTDIVNDAPVLRLLAADTASNGTQHMYLKEVGAPVVGFRAANKGRDLSSSSDELVTLALKILDGTFKIDKGLADAYTKGGATAKIAREARRHLRAAFAAVEFQFFRGSDAAGFAGFPDADELKYLDADMVIGAGGTAGSPSVLTSVYAIRSTPDMANCVAIMGQDGEISIGESVVIESDELDEDGVPNGKTYPAYYTPVTGWVGLQLGSKNSVARLANLNATDKTLDDDLMSQLLELFPESAPPTMFVMNKRSRGQLARSRTSYSPTGMPAPLPTEYEGIPIVVTGGIASNETQVIDES